MALKQPLEKMAEFALRLGISLRTLTELTQPGVHPTRVDTLDKIAVKLKTSRTGVFEMIGADNGQERGTPKPDQFAHLSADALLSLADELKAQAAKKRGDGGGKKKRT